MAAEKVLVVDDEQLTRTILVSLLRREGYGLESARDAEEALRILAVKPLDLIVVSLSTSGEQALRLVDHIRARQLQIPVILIMRAEEAEQAVAGMRNGAYDVVFRPFQNDVMLAAVARGVTYGKVSRRDVTYRNGLEHLVEARTSLLREAMFELERSYDTTLEALGDALDLKDSETEGHSRRVTAYTIALARRMGIDPSEMKTIKHGAFLHDIGKMAIPDAILLKPGRLDHDEVSVMRRHCLSGYQIVRKIPFLKEAADIVYSHQEHYDGGGYPRQLRGEEIPLGARIFAVADTLDAITSDRPYRRGSPFSSARNEIARCAGSQFDPRVVDAFLSMPSEVWEELRDAITGQAGSLARAVGI
ncbi:HD domain-containing phosphohydrolase [Acidipila sp. EB88]|uniref:HD domain-containing phosphohydrolase n=1 Tax=Acidipila sp. EB88 TaxID=2305226 RepID=UPI000F5EB2B6|nr:HD domain-containing phosphohydrolase [Acidipila sp. EB88]RRA47423.1 response regulator [Acidipila sp. EB88]